MELQALRERVESTCEFPVEQSELLDAVGSVEIEPGTSGSETVATVLERTDETTFESPRALYNTIRGTVDDDHVGRKHYDDRGGSRVNDDAESL